MTTVDSGKVWLVKSSGRLLGPFSFSEIEELLKKKVITPLDEIRTPTQGWNYIREFPDLMAIIFRQQADTLTQTYTDTTRTQTTETITQSVLDFFEMDSNSESLRWRLPSPEVGTKKETAITFFENKQTSSKKTNFSTIRTNISVRWILPVLLVTLVFGIVSGFWVYKKKRNLEMEAASKLELARSFFYEKNFDKSLKFYEDLFSNHQSVFTPSDFYRYGMLLLEKKKASNEAHNLYKRLSRPKKSEDLINWLKFSYILAGDQNRWNDAISMLQELMGISIDRSLSILMVQAEIMRGDLVNADATLRQAFSGLQPIAETRNRAWFLKHWLQAQLQKQYTIEIPNEYTIYLIFHTMLKIWGDLEMGTSDFSHILASISETNPFDFFLVDFGPFEQDFIIKKKVLSELCPTLVHKLSETRNVILSSFIKSFCLAIEGRPNWVSQVLSMDDDPLQNELWFGWLANLLVVNEFDSEALNFLSRCQSGLLWCHLARIRFCIKKNQYCQNVRDLKLDSKKSGLIVEVFEAWRSLQHGNEFFSRDFLKKIKSEYPSLIIMGELW